MVLEKTPECSLDSKETKSVSFKGNQSWIFIGRTDAEAEARILWPPAAKSWLIGKDPDAGKDWGQEDKGMTEDEMVGWYHRLNGHQFEQIPEDSDKWGSPACCRVARSWYDWATEQRQIPSHSSDSVSLERVGSGLTCVSTLWSLSCRKLTDSERRPGCPLSSWPSISFPNITHTTSSTISARCGLREREWKDLVCVIKRRVFLRILTLFW